MQGWGRVAAEAAPPWGSGALLSRPVDSSLKVRQRREAWREIGGRSPSPRSPSARTRRQQVSPGTRFNTRETSIASRGSSDPPEPPGSKGARFIPSGCLVLPSPLPPFTQDLNLGRPVSFFLYFNSDLSSQVGPANLVSEDRQHCLLVADSGSYRGASRAEPG